jgi:hypothetical protein
MYLSSVSFVRDIALGFELGEDLRTRRSLRILKTDLSLYQNHLRSPYGECVLYSRWSDRIVRPRM